MRAPAVVALALLLASCASLRGGVRYDITVEATAAAKAKPRRVTLAPVGAPDATFARAALYAAAILGANGYAVADSLADTDLLVVVDAGISDGETIVWEVPPGHPESGARRQTAYSRHLRLTAFDWRELESGKSRREVFRVGATSVGTTGELEEVLPYLAAALQVHVGDTLREPEDTAMSADDERALWLKQMVEGLGK